jgi:hypothetical protein
LSKAQIPATPTKADEALFTYRFVGWFYTYTDGNEYRFEPDKHAVLGDMVLQARFAKVKKTATLTLLGEDGTPVNTLQVAIGEAIVLGATPTKAHYTGVWEYQGEGDTPSVMPAEGVTFKAVYAPTEYKVIFYKNEVGTEVLATKTYTMVDKTVVAPEVEKKTGFAGAWETYVLDGGDVEVRPVYTATSPDEAQEDGCASVVWTMPIVAIALASCLVLVLRKKVDEGEEV